jgi:hypothetical protein
MAVKDMQSSMDETIQNLKNLLTTLQSVNESLTEKIDDIKEDDADRQELVSEFDHDLEGLVHRLEEYEENVQSHLDEMEDCHNEDFETVFASRVQALTEAYEGSVHETTTRANEAHTSLQSAHEQLVTAQQENHEAETEANQVAASLSGETQELYESIIAALQKANEQHDSHVAETRGGFSGLIGVITQATLNGSGLMDMIADAANTALKESAREGWGNLREQCEQSTTTLGEWVRDLLEQSETHGQEGMEGLAKLLRESLRPPLEEAFHNTHEDGASSLINELTELVQVTSASAEAASALNPMLPELTATERVVEDFEKVLEMLCGAD